MNATASNYIGLALLAAFAGCATAPRVYESELDRAPLTSKIEPQDIRRTVEKMTDSLLQDSGVLDATKGEKPVLDIEPMKNKSQMIVDMKSLTDSVRMRLIRSRQFRFVDRSTSGADIAIMDEQAQLGLTDPSKAIRGGKQSAAQMFLTGELTEMSQRVGRVVDRYYKFSMILKDLRSGEIVWADEQEIRKVANRPMF
ncbi:MAG: penicillin-binding protein activator LpoB [Kiritimatiellae bacterium]|nr:penicillin-binding protein activator LpoB [Kiritimatiellia bacterium]